MPEDRGLTVVSDTSPLLYLHRVGQLDLLRRLYGRIFVPEQVGDEIKAGGADGPDIRSLSWIQPRTIGVPTMLRMVPDLGPGEAGAIALALETGPHSLLLLDDRLARRIAIRHNVPMTGTAGVLLKAKQMGFISSVRSLIEELIASGFYLRPDHTQMLFRIAGET